MSYFLEICTRILNNLKYNLCSYMYIVLFKKKEHIDNEQQLRTSIVVFKNNYA